MRSLNPDQLAALQQVIQLGSYSAAARRLNLSQPAVSLQIRELEARLGIRLVERVGKRIHATAAGRELVEHARRIALDIESAIAAMRWHKEGAQGRVRLGSGLSPLAYLLPPILRRLREQHPGIELVIEATTSKELIERVLRNEVDLAVVILPFADRSLRIMPVREDRLIAALPPGTELPTRPIGPRELVRHTLLLESPRAKMGELVRDWFAAAGIEPHPAMELDSIEAIRNVVAAGLGASILPIELIHGHATTQDIVVRPLRPALIRRLAVVQRRDKPDHPALRIVRDALLTLGEVPLPVVPDRATPSARTRSS